MEFRVLLGGLLFNIRSKYPIVRDHYGEYITYKNEPAIDVSVSTEDLLYEWQAYSEYISKTDRWICYEPTLERLAISRKIVECLPSHSSMLMHGAVICDNDSAIMLTAPSGTGKTTRAELFLGKHPSGWILNGDKPILRFEGRQVVACGTPWKGKEKYGINAERKLNAIFLLSRSDKTRIYPVTVSEVFDDLVHQVFLPNGRENILNTLQLIKRLDGSVRLFRLDSPANAEAIEAAFRAAQDD